MTVLRTIAQMTQRGSTMIIIVLAIRFLMRNYPKRISYIAWLPVGISLLLPQRISVPIIPAAAGMVRTAGGTNGVLQLANQVADGTLNATTAAGNDGYHILLWIWVAGITSMTIYTIVQYLRLYSCIRNAKRQHENIYVIHGLESPFSFGIINPRVYLPEDTSEENARYIIAHEQVHIKRHDGLFKLIGYLALCIHFFNPLVWIAFHEFEMDMEMSCDEEVSRNMSSENCARYAESLVESVTEHHKPLASSFSNQKREVSKRVKNIFASKKKGVAILAVTAAIILMVFISVSKFTVRANSGTESALAFRNPFDSPELTCSYSCTVNHNGEDIRSIDPSETEIKAVADGTVLAKGTDETLGDWIVISHKDHWYSFYAALGNTEVKINEPVKSGEAIAVLGLSGKSTDPHVHVAIRQFADTNQSYAGHFLATGAYPDDQIYQFYEGVIPSDDSAAAVSNRIAQENLDALNQYNQEMADNGYVYDDSSATVDTRLFTDGNACIYSDYVDVVIYSIGDNLTFEIGSHCLDSSSGQGPIVSIMKNSVINQLPSEIQPGDHAKLYYQFPAGFRPSSYEDYIKYSTALKGQE